MGCGESKQAVATENTLAKSKSKNLENNPPIEKPENDVAEDVETNVKENGNEIRDADKKESEGGSENSPSKETGGGGDVKEFGVDENVVVVEENMKKDNDDGDQEELLKGGEKEKQLLVSNESPKENDDHDHEVVSIESIISEGISGKSDYYSPRAKGHEEKDAEAKLNKEKVAEEVLKVDEGKAVATQTDETKSSGEENISATAKNANFNKALETEGVEASNKLIHDGKQHRPSYLIGRLIQKKKPKSKSSASSSVQVADQYVADLTAKIRAQLQQ